MEPQIRAVVSGITSVANSDNVHQILEELQKALQLIEGSKDEELASVLSLIRPTPAWAFQPTRGHNTVLIVSHSQEAVYRCLLWFCSCTVIRVRNSSGANYVYALLYDLCTPNLQFLNSLDSAKMTSFSADIFHLVSRFVENPQIQIMLCETLLNLVTGAIASGQGTNTELIGLSLQPAKWISSEVYLRTRLRPLR